MYIQSNKIYHYSTSYLGEEDDDETEEIRRGPKIQNAFDLLNDED